MFLLAVLVLTGAHGFLAVPGFVERVLLDDRNMARSLLGVATFRSNRAVSARFYLDYGGIAACWKNTLYCVPVFDTMKGFHFDPKTGLISPTPASQTVTYFDYPTALVSILSNGNKDGIVWAPQDDGYYTCTRVVQQR